jgi:DNA-binding HxlR family transcriptional regulator
MISDICTTRTIGASAPVLDKMVRCPGQFEERPRPKAVIRDYGCAGCDLVVAFPTPRARPRSGSRAGGRPLDLYDYIGRVIAVTRSRRPSPQVIRVLQALAADPARWRYGYDLATEVHLKSGSLYPILIRLADRALLETSWEPGPPGRPPRHLYRLTPTGREYVAALDAARIERSVPRRRLGLSGA